jgi:hypothetical protein
VEAGALLPLVDNLLHSSQEGMEKAAGVLAILAAGSDDVRAAVAETGSIHLLTARLRGGWGRGCSDKGRVNAANALENLMASNRIREIAVIKAGAIPPLVEMLRSDSTEGKDYAASTLRNLASSLTSCEADGAVKQAIVEARGLPLVEMLRGGSNAEKAAELLRDIG